jgi:uncharacterized repeat protein (TIGR01451 family)
MLTQVSKMKTKLIAFSILMMLAINTGIIYPAVAEENEFQWPTSWILADTDQNESGYNDDYRDVQYVYYCYDDTYLYFRMECYGYPNFTVEPESRYKWFLDANDPYNMAWQGGNVYEAEFLLFVEDTPKPGGDGSGDVYLLNDVDGDGYIGDDWPEYETSPGPIINASLAGYRILEHCLDVYICLSAIDDPMYSYFTWATDQEDPNLDSSANERSEHYWNQDLSKADVSAVISDNVDFISPGSSLTYNLTVANHGPHEAANIGIQHSLPEAVIFVDATPIPTSIRGQNVWWNQSSLAVGTSVSLTVHVMVDEDAPVGVITALAIAHSDTYDPLPGNNIASIETLVDLDTDGDGIPNSIDSDDDNDGWSDEDEIFYGTDPLDQNDYPVDTDGDGIPDSIDDDDDNDGYPDDEDAFPLDPNEWADNDGDGIGDNADPDDDNDGWTDEEENQYGTNPFDTNDYPIDTDGDGIPDSVDDDDDNDGWTDDEENDYGSDPLNPDDHPPENTPPSQVVGLTVSDAKNGKLDLSWDPATDNVGVDHYEIHRDGIFFINVTATTYRDIGLANGRLYTYMIRAVDAVGNTGEFSEPVSGTPTRSSSSYIPSNDEPSETETPIMNESTPGENDTGVLIIPDMNNTMLPPPLITGPSEGYVNVSYAFNISINDFDALVRFIIDWGDNISSETEFLQASSPFSINHSWSHPGDYVITVNTVDEQRNTTANMIITIYEEVESPAPTPESSNWMLLLLALFAFLALLFTYLIGRRKKDDEETGKK